MEKIGLILQVIIPGQRLYKQINKWLKFYQISGSSGESILKLRKQKLKQKEKLKESIWHLYLNRLYPKGKKTISSKTNQLSKRVTS